MRIRLAFCVLTAAVVTGFMERTPVLANLPEQTVQVSFDSEQLPTIKLAPGRGVNISFIPTGSAIEKVWLDDPSWVVLSADGCLVGLGIDSTRMPRQGGQNCSNSPTSVLHLRRIDALPIPGIPKSDSTQLTVITRSPALGRQILVFRLVKATETPYYTVEVVDSSRQIEQSRIDLAAIERGRKFALEQSLLLEGSALDLRIVDFISRLQQRQSLEMAQRQSRISWQLISRLAELGSTPNPSPTEKVPVVSTQLEGPTSSFQQLP
ncbi:MAG: hypothetical protein LDL41_19170 [Coleofasciculus sp. S288]|nr:hypothetical protein [Coleofasciculus sp. S288]